MIGESFFTTKISPFTVHAKSIDRCAAASKFMSISSFQMCPSQFVYLTQWCLDEYLFIFPSAICLLDKVTQSSCTVLMQYMYILVLMKEMANIYDAYCHQVDINFLFCIIYDQGLLIPFMTI